MPQKIRTYLEMTDPDELRPGRFAPDVALTPTADHTLVRSLQVQVGTPYGWGSATRGDAGWEQIFARPDLSFWVITGQEEPVGVVVFADQHPEVEIETFGLVPEAVGRGIGAHALTLAIRQAWTLRPGVQRVWLHTNSMDHPNALPNYQARGLRPYRTEVVAALPSSSVESPDVSELRSHH